MIRSDAHHLSRRATVAAPGADPGRWIRGRDDRPGPGAPPRAPHRRRGLAGQPRQLHALHPAAAGGLLRRPGAAARGQPAARHAAPTQQLVHHRRRRVGRPGWQRGEGDGTRRRPAHAALRHAGAGAGRRDARLRHPRRRGARGRHEVAGRCLQPAQPHDRDPGARRPGGGPGREAGAAHLRGRRRGILRRRDGGRGRGLHPARAKALLPEAAPDRCQRPPGGAARPDPAGDAGADG